MKITTQQKKAYENEKARIEALLDSGNTVGGINEQYWELVKKEAELILDHASVIKDIDTEKAGLGTVFTAAIDGEIIESQLVQENYLPLTDLEDVDFTSIDSPIGKAVADKMAGERIEYSVGNRNFSGIVLSLSDRFASELEDTAKIVK